MGFAALTLTAIDLVHLGKALRPPAKAAQQVAAGETSLNHVSRMSRQGRQRAVTLAGGGSARLLSRSR